MSKSTYIIISGLISFSFIPVKLFPFFTRDVQLILMLIWSIFGFYYYPKYSDLYTNKNRNIVFLFFILFFFSSLTPVFRYNQDFIATVIAMRGNLVIIFLLTLFKIKPKEEDFYASFKTLSIIALILSILAFFFPHLFLSTKTLYNLNIRQSQGSTDILAIWLGYPAVIFYFYMSLGRMIQKSNKNDFLWCTICMLYIFIMQNRSMLIGTIPFYIYGLIKADIRYKNLIIILIALTMGGFIYTIVSSLIQESTEQLNNSNYNRWQAVSFYLFEQKNNLYTILFGQGVPCANSSYLEYIRDAQNNRYAIASDIGLLGSYFFYGISTLIVIYYFVFLGIFKKAIPLYVKFYCLWILFVPTIHLFAQGMEFGSTIRLLFIIYLVVYYKEQSIKIST